MTPSNKVPVRMPDTIVAISTPQGVGGIAVVRLSGPEAVAIASRYCRVPEETHKAQFSTFYKDISRHSLVDEVVVTLFRAPHSYTGEDVVEISCHGSLYVQRAILDALLERDESARIPGARLAEPGEFTRRAFLNGKLDLSQAEAVADLIDSTNAGAHALAISQLRGGYAQRLRELREQFVELTSLMELELDFSEEDVEFADRRQLLALLDRVEEECRRLSESFRLGNAIKRGVPVAIIGRPNAGKSSLLNALLGDDRAIVSPVPGTTRDTIEEVFVVEGTAFRIIDTAGLRQSHDKIEQLGIERTYKAVEQADIVIYVHDATQPESQIDEDLKDLGLDGKHLIIVYNKIDLLPPKKDTSHLWLPVGRRPRFAPHTVASLGSPLVVSQSERRVNSFTLPSQRNVNEVTSHLSSKTGEGIDTLLSKFSIFNSQFSIQGDTVLLTNVRHYHALQHVLEALAQVRKGLQEALPADLVAIDLRDALHHLGTITGQVTTDEVLGSIFSRFCIGK